jgi:acetoacetate decarboxylase
MANIQFRRQGKEIEGLTERHGQFFFEVKARMTGQLNFPEAQNILMEVFRFGPSLVVVSFNFKYFLAPEGDGFDYPPRLMREEVEFRPKALEIGEAELKLHPSEFDPWAEVEPVRVLGAFYTVGHNSMRKGKIVGESDPAAFQPYSFMKTDF